MDIEHLLVVCLALLGIILLTQLFSSRFNVPHAILLMAGGFLVSEAVVAFGLDTGIRAENFQDLILKILLPVLVFESAIRMDSPLLLKNIAPILFLAVGGMLLTTLIVGAGLYYGIAHPIGFPWVAALLAGAMLAATDPVAVISQFKPLGVPHRLEILLEGESLFNDATAIVLFSLFLIWAQESASPLNIGGALLKFLYVFCMGIVVGGGVGMAGHLLKRFFSCASEYGVLSLAVCYGAFMLAEGALHVSGVMAVLSAGLAFAWQVNAGNVPGVAQKKTQEKAFNDVWDVIAYLANGAVFVLMGVTVTIAMFQERWLAMLIAIITVIVARALTIWGSVGVLSFFMKVRIVFVYQNVMIWGGLRGGVTLALALSLPVSLDYWWTIQSIAFGVVLFTMLVQASTMPALLRFYGLTR